MWRIKITLWQRIKHIFGKHVPIQWNDGSTTCLICKRILQNPGNNINLIRVECNYNIDGAEFKQFTWVDKNNRENIGLNMKNLSASVERTILAKTRYCDKLEERMGQQEHQ